MSTADSIYAETTARVVAALEAGTVPWRKPWRTIAGTLPQNLTSRKPYRGINPFLLSLEPYESPYWLSYKQAKQRGGHVRKGERGTVVVFWRRITVKDEEAESGTRIVPLLRQYRVFNLEQCDGIEAPAVEELPAFEPLAECEAIVAAYEHPPGLSHEGDRACYIPAWDHVRMPVPEAFEPREEYYSTLFHELVHSTGHESRLGRDDLREAKGFGSEPYSREELTAEMGAAMLCGAAGIQPVTLSQSAAYIAGWLERLAGDPRLVVTAAARAQRAADLIRGVRYDDAR